MATENESRAVGRYYQKKKKRRKRRVMIFYTLLLAFALTAAAILSMTVFFNIEHIEVTGQNRYTARQVIDAGAIENGMNMFRLDKFKTINQIKQSLPYISEITINRKLPDTLVIEVGETIERFYTIVQNKTVIFDDKLKVLEVISELDTRNLALVSGIAAIDAVPGEGLVYEDGLGDILRTVIENIESQMDIELVAEINLKSKFDITIYYEGRRLTIVIGSADKLKTKLQLVMHAIKENPKNEIARIDVSSGKLAYYRPVQVSAEE